MDMQQLTSKLNELSQKLSVWFSDLPNKIKNLPETVMAMPNDERIAWSAIILGVIFVIAAIIIL